MLSSACEGGSNIQNDCFLFVGFLKDDLFHTLQNPISFSLISTVEPKQLISLLAFVRARESECKHGSSEDTCPTSPYPTTLEVTMAWPWDIVAFTVQYQTLTYGP